MITFFRYTRSPTIAPLGLICAGLFAFTLLSRQPVNVCSGLLSTNTVMNGMILIPVAGVAFGSVMAIREYRCGLRTSRKTAAKIGHLDAPLEILAAMSWIWLISGLAYLILVVYSSSDCDGTLNGVAVAATAVGVSISVPIGYFVSYALPYVMTLPALLAASYLVVVVVTSSYGDIYTLWFPVTGATMSVFYTWQDGIFSSQLSLFAGLVLATLCGRALLNHRSRITLAGTGMSLVLVAVGIFALAPHKGRWENTSEVVAYTPYCIGASPQVCVSPAFKRAAPLVAEAFAPFMTKVEGTALFAEVIEQRPRSSRGEATLDQARAFRLDDGGEQTIRGSVAEYIEEAADLDACYRLPAEGDPLIAVAAPYNEVVTGWLLDIGAMPGSDARASGWFSSLTPDQQKTWFNSHVEKFLTCTLTGADFR